MPHINKLRKERGYNWEKLIVNFANSQKGYFARRLGGSSTGLPDIVITHNESGTIYAIEAKSVTSQNAYIPLDQIQRCLYVLQMFGYYQIRYMWFVFKFGVNKSTYQATTTKDGAKIKFNDKKKIYLFKVTFLSNMENIKSVVCDSEGNLSIIPEKDILLKPLLEATRYTQLSDLLINNNQRITQSKLV